MKFSISESDVILDTISDSISDTISESTSEAIPETIPKAIPKAIPKVTYKFDSHQLSLKNQSQSQTNKPTNDTHSKYDIDLTKLTIFNPHCVNPDINNEEDSKPTFKPSNISSSSSSVSSAPKLSSTFKPSNTSNTSNTKPSNTFKPSNTHKGKKLFSLNNNVYTITSTELGGGGDCFFYTVCEILKKCMGISTSVGNLRQIVSKTVSEFTDEEYQIHSNTFDEPISKQELVKRMENKKYDADNLAINIIGIYYKIKFLIYNTNTNKFTCDGNNYMEKYDVIGCLYYTGGHYQLGNIYKNNNFMFSYCKKEELSTNDDIHEFLNIIYNDKKYSSLCEDMFM